MSAQFISVNVPGGFNNPAGGDDKDQRKPGREHEDEATFKQRRKEKTKARKTETKAKASRESDVEMMMLNQKETRRMPHLSKAP